MRPLEPCWHNLNRPTRCKTFSTRFFLVDWPWTSITSWYLAVNAARSPAAYPGSKAPQLFSRRGYPVGHCAGPR